MRQRDDWRNEVRPKLEPLVDAKLAGGESVASPTTGRRIYFLRHRTANTYLFGEPSFLRSELAIPGWDETGAYRSYQVDHRLELQLDGKNETENWELLDETANMSSGPKIDQEIVKRVNAAVMQYVGGGAGSIWAAPPDVRQVFRDYEIQFQSIKPNLPVRGDPDKYWPLSPRPPIDRQVDKGGHLTNLEVMTAEQIEKAHLRGEPTELVIYSAPRGGIPRRIPWNAAAGSVQTVKPSEGMNWYPGFNLTEVMFEPGIEEGGRVGLITGEAFKGNTIVSDARLTWEIRKVPNIGYGGYVSGDSVLTSIREVLQLRGLSPIRFAEAHLDDVRGLVAIGQVLPDVPLFSRLGIDVVVEGNSVRLRRLFSAGELTLPGPFRITGSTLEVFADTESGLGAEGEVNFEIPQLGRGRIGARATTGVPGRPREGEAAGGFAIEGEFEFDSTLFDPARVAVWYRRGAFGGRGELGVPEGKIRGIRRARVTAEFERERVAASGDFELTIPGVKRGTISLAYSQETGLTVGGSLELADNIPGIRGGSVEVEVSKRPEGEGYRVFARGTAVPRIPGIDATLSVTYDDGAFVIQGDASFRRGLLSGTVSLGATNRPLDAEGRPTGEPPAAGGALRAFGGGSVTLRLAPWLQGTVGVKLKPNGEVEISGTVGLPAALDTFPEKSYTRNIFTIGIDIPIVGVAFAGQRIGIFATIRGGLDLSAGVGPGQLKDLHLTVTYNPDREAETRVGGGAQLYIPAHAGLRLFVRGGIGAGIPIVSATAGLEIGGELGLEGAVEAAVTVDWTPTRGLVLDASGEIHVEPKLKFDVSAFVRVEADLLFKTIELYNRRWELASFEFGSGLRFGVRLPIHYEEGKPFDVNWSDVQFQVPDIDPEAVLKGLLARVTGGS